jgi:hypothetical protein
MEIIKQLQKELKIKIKEVEETKNNKDFEVLEFEIINLFKRLLKENKDKYKLNMIYNNIDV